VLLDVATALANIPSAAERARIEVELFGKGAQQLDAMLREGGAGLRALAAEAQNLGLVFDRDMIEKAAQAEGAIRILKQEWDAFAALLLAKLTPTIIRVIDELTKLFNLKPSPSGNFTSGVNDEIQTLSMVDAEIAKVRKSYEAYYTANAKDAAEEHQLALKHIKDEEELNALLLLRARVTDQLGQLGRRMLIPPVANPLDNLGGGGGGGGGGAGPGSVTGGAAPASGTAGTGAGAGASRHSIGEALRSRSGASAGSYFGRSARTSSHASKPFGERER
jgi:hypothetical protein